MYDDPVLDIPFPEPQVPATEISDAERRFASCRWHKRADPDQPAHCTQRDVLSLAGAHGFSPESWCVDCEHYKLRRVVKKAGVGLQA